MPTHAQRIRTQDRRCAATCRRDGGSCSFPDTGPWFLSGRERHRGRTASQKDDHFHRWELDFFVWHRSERNVSSLPSSWVTNIVYFSMYVTAMVTIQTWVCLSCVPSWGQRDGKMRKRLLGQALNRMEGKPKDEYGTDIRQNWQARTISEFCFKRETYSAWVWMQFTIFSRRRILTHLNVSLFFLNGNVYISWF